MRSGGSPSSRAQWLHRGQARSHRYSTVLGRCAVPVGAGLPANSLTSPYQIVPISPPSIR
ncbi:hypothetical protein E6B08_24850 [Pseudomonas putida]|uniref:Uncharacterized protein n=1 Tax=Pseudomonas putida TaxID=303 RepID=A0A4D6XIZ2_PSEPU|nr:hypothetical protein E6B08_24850 [Pseudomonas putida]